MPQPIAGGDAVSHAGFADRLRPIFTRAKPLADADTGAVPESVSYDRPPHSGPGTLSDAGSQAVSLAGPEAVTRAKPATRPQAGAGTFANEGAHATVGPIP
jgi:hypothetical protein